MLCTVHYCKISDSIFITSLNYILYNIAVTTGKRLNRSDPQLQLMHDLFEDYDKYVLPVLDFNTPIHLAVDFTPVLISDLVCNIL